MVTAVVSNAVPRTSWMLTRLATETHTHHAAIDSALGATVRDPTLGGYRYLLARIYGFEAPVANALSATRGLDAEFARRRARASWLAADLIALGLTRAEHGLLARRHEVPRLDGAPEGLGWLYVLEMISLRVTPLRARLHEKVLTVAGSYLMTARDAATRDLGATLDLVTHTPTIAKRIVAGAHDGFDSLRRWLASTPPWDGF